MTNTASKGRRYENEIKEMFENAGYIVTRAAASQGLWDLVAIKITDSHFTGERHKKISFLCLVQCKHHKLKKLKAAKPAAPSPALP